MKITDVWEAACVRLGANAESARTMIAFMASLASSPEAFERWNSKLPDGAARALLRGFEEEGGEDLAEKILLQFREMVMARFGITQEEMERQTKQIGLN